MLLKFQCLILLVVVGLLSSVSSRSIAWSTSASTAASPATTLAPLAVHLDVHETSYSSEEKYKYINECVRKCMANHPPASKPSMLDTGRDNCIQLQCRIYQRRR